MEIIDLCGYCGFVVTIKKDITARITLKDGDVVLPFCSHICYHKARNNPEKVIIFKNEAEYKKTFYKIKQFYIKVRNLGKNPKKYWKSKKKIIHFFNMKKVELNN